jgi:hypothetical protein
MVGIFPGMKKYLLLCFTSASKGFVAISVTDKTAIAI